ncbi:MAG: hypothetical protein ACT4OY_07190 [Alphaproteobacteria bacterium]
MPILFEENTPLRSLNIQEAKRNRRYSDEGMYADIFDNKILRSSGEEKIIIVGLGPSLNQISEDGIKTNLENLKNRKDGIVVLAAAAHKMLNDGKLDKADFTIFNLLGASYANQVEPVRSDVLYLLASHCDAALFDKIEKGDAEINTWNAYVPKISSGEHGEIEIGAGSTGGTAALAVFMALGFKQFEFYGVDGSVLEVDPHSYGVPFADAENTFPDNPNADVLTVSVAGKIYEVERNFLNQTLEMKAFVENYREDIHVIFHGESLSSALINNPEATAELLHDPRPLESAQKPVEPKP